MSDKKKPGFQLSLFQVVRMRLTGVRRNRIDPNNIHDIEVFEKEKEDSSPPSSSIISRLFGRSCCGKSRKDVQNSNLENDDQLLFCHCLCSGGTLNGVLFRIWMKIKLIFTKTYWQTFVVDPSLPSYYRWLIVVSIAVFYNLLMIIARSVFWQLQEQNFVLWICLDYFCDILYFIDMFVQLKTAYLEQGLIVTDPLMMRRNYFKKTISKVDIISILPTDFLYLALSTDIVIVRLNRILRFHRVTEFFDRTEAQSSRPNLTRILTLLVYIIIIIHCNACIYFQVSHWLGLGSDLWVHPSIEPLTPEGLPNLNASLLHMYLFCFYWSTITMTTIGDLPVPERDEEYVFMIIDFLVGVFLFVSIVNKVGGMLTNMNANRTEFQQRQDSVKRYLEVRKVNKELETKVVKWFDYLWSHNHSLDGEAALNILPAKLKAEIAINVHLGNLKRVAIFKECETGLLVELVLKLKQTVYSPGDYVCRKGDIGRELYIIKSGKLQVVGNDGVTVFATLSEGTVFGEISVLNIAGNKNGNRRTANIRSLGYSDLFVLSKEDLWQALQEYPEARKMLIEKGRQMLRKDNLLDEEEAAKQDVNYASPEEKLENLESTFQAISGRLSTLVQEACSMEEELTGKLAEIEKKIQLKSMK